MATICSREPLKSFPFSNVFSVSDGADVAKSTGIPYFYMSESNEFDRDENGIK